MKNLLTPQSDLTDTPRQSVGSYNITGRCNPTKTTASQQNYFQNMTKNWQRHAREWPQHGDIEVDYATGRKLTGEWKAMETREPRDRYNRPIVAGPQLMVNQWDKALDAHLDHAELQAREQRAGEQFIARFTQRPIPIIIIKPKDR